MRRCPRRADTDGFLSIEGWALVHVVVENMAGRIDPFVSSLDLAGGEPNNHMGIGMWRWCCFVKDGPCRVDAFVALVAFAFGRAPPTIQRKVIPSPIGYERCARHSST
jgi:hypothetical protein